MDGSAVDGWTALRAVGDEWVGRRGWLLLLGNTGRRCSVLSVEVKAFTGESLPATDGRTLATQTDARTAVRYARCCTAPRWWCPHGASANLSCPASAVGLVRTRTGERGVPPRGRGPSRAVTSLRPTPSRSGLSFTCRVGIPGACRPTAPRPEPRGASESHGRSAAFWTGGPGRLGLLLDCYSVLLLLRDYSSEYDEPCTTPQ